MRTMASQMDKSADLFALKARSRNCLSSYCEPTGAARPLQVQKQEMAAGTNGRAGRNLRRLQAADGTPNEFCKPTFHKIQIQPIEQPSTEEFGGEAA